MTTELVLLSRVAYRDQEITGPRLRGLLALLAGDLRTGCGTARLVAGLWPDEQPENPTKALQILVSRARARLGPDLIVKTPVGYRLRLDEDQVDSSAVLLSASASARHSRAGDHAAALAHAEAGLALWDGPCSGGPSSGGPSSGGASSGGERPDDPVCVLRAERASTYQTLLRSRALALSRLGRHAEAVDPLTELAARRPRDEELLRELLRSEAATVGASAALARYDAYRRALRDELGTDPGAALQAVHQQLLGGTAPAVRHGVPYEPNQLLGRDSDIAAVADLLRAGRVTSIVGPGGLGKTRLAYAVCRAAEQRVVHLVPLAGLATGAGCAEVASEVASVLGSGETHRAAVGQVAGSPDAVAGILGALGTGPALLALDNCEHVIHGAAELVRALVSMNQHLRVLTTSRAPLGLSSESVYPLPELSLPTSIELFEQRARAARPGAALPADAVAEVCRHLDGLPLAVELAAARVRAMSVPEIARRLADRFGLLRGGARDAPERHRTLHAVVDWSWHLLDPTGQAAMRALSIFPDGFTADAAGHLLGGGDVLPVLEQLVDHSLLKVVDTPAGTRFRMLETVREFSAAYREEAGETDRAVAAFLAWARDFGTAQHGSLLGTNPFAAAERVGAEQDNLIQAQRLGLTREDGAVVAATAAALAGLWMINSSYTRMLSLSIETSWLLSHYRPEPEFVEATRAAATLCAVGITLLQGPRATRSLATLRRLPPAPRDTLLGAIAAIMEATTGKAASDPSVLYGLCDSDEPLVAGIAYCLVGYLLEKEGDPEGALWATERMLRTCQRWINPWSQMLAHGRIGELCQQLERGEQARVHLGAALRMLEELGPSWPNSMGLRAALVLANLQVGDIDEAERALELAEQDRVDEAYGLVTFDLGVRAEIRLARGDVPAGLRLWRRAIDQLQHTEDPLFRIEPAGLEPWALEVRAAGVLAHAYHGRLDLVEEEVGELPRLLSAMLANPVANPPPYLMELPVCGALLLALAMVDLDRARRTGDERARTCGARMIALAERFRFVRSFQPTMSSARARQAAEQADSAAYAQAVSSYADLANDDLRAAALAAVRATGRWGD